MNRKNMNDFLDSIIQNAHYLRNVAEIPDNPDFLTDIINYIQDADSFLHDVCGSVNDFDPEDWS